MLPALLILGGGGQAHTYLESSKKCIRLPIRAAEKGQAPGVKLLPEKLDQILWLAAVELKEALPALHVKTAEVEKQWKDFLIVTPLCNTQIHSKFPACLLIMMLEGTIQAA